MIRFSLISIFCAVQLFAFAQIDTAHIYTFGGSQDEQGMDIEPTTDKGYVMVGATSSFGNGNSDIYVVKVDSNINYQWSNAIGSFHLEFGHAIKQTADEGYIICGYSNSGGNGSYDGYLVKINSSGALKWQKFYGGFDWDKFYDIEVTSDGGYMIVGETHSSGAGDADAWVVKTDSAGTVEWEKYFGGKNKDIAYDLIKTSDGNFAFCGETRGSGLNFSAIWLVKFSKDSNVLFDYNYANNRNEIGFGLTERTNKSYFIVGQKMDVDSSHIDERMIMTDKDGKILKNNDSFYGNQEDVLKSVIEGANGMLFTAGYSNSFGNGAVRNKYGVRSISIAQNLDLLFGPVLGDGQYNQRGFKIVEGSNGGRLVVGTYQGSKNTYNDMGVTFYKADTVAEKYFVKEMPRHEDNSLLSPLGVDIHENKSYSIYPNPVKDILTISSLDKILILRIDIFDMQGKRVATSPNGKNQIDLSNLRPGVFILKIYDERNAVTITKILHE